MVLMIHTELIKLLLLNFQSISVTLRNDTICSTRQGFTYLVTSLLAMTDITEGFNSPYITGATDFLVLLIVRSK